MRDWIQNVKFEDQLSEVEKAAWKSWKNITTSSFLGTHKADNYTDIEADLIQSYKAMGYDVLSKVFFLDCRLDLLLENLRTLSDEQGERFHKDISTMERLYQGEWTPRILVDYCCTLRRDVLLTKYEGGGDPNITTNLFLKNRIFLWTFSKLNHPQNTHLENQYTYPTAFSIVKNSSETLAKW